MLDEVLYSKIEAAGFKMKIFRAEHLKEIHTVFEQLAAQKLLDKDFYKNNLTDFNFDYEKALENGKSVVMIAAPQCKSVVEFKFEGDTLLEVIPPTYIYPDITSRITGILDEVLAGKGFSYAKAILPLKLLAARSGLGQYGRNNICYISGFGSFIRLFAFITDYEFEEDSWGDMKAMESCGSCTACIDHCPTGAIDRERFLIHAENCITNFNEYDTPIPEWISPQWHDSIIGCMKCQTVCPHNSGLKDLVDERIYFDEKETGMLLGGSTFDSLPAETRKKIIHMGMESYYGVLPRNIRLLINKK